jgi:hypothetical protein
VICYILPGVLYWKIGTHQTSRYLGAGLAVFGALFGIVSVTVQIIDLIASKD